MPEQTRPPQKTQAMDAAPAENPERDGHRQEQRTGPFGDAIPREGDVDPRARRSLPQEDVEDRENVGTVKPEDYPGIPRPEDVNPG